MNKMKTEKGGINMYNFLTCFKRLTDKNFLKCDNVFTIDLQDSRIKPIYADYILRFFCTSATRIY